MIRRNKSAGLRSHVLPRLFSGLLASILLLGCAADAAAQARYRPRYIEPEWLTFHLSEISAGVYAEGTFESDTYNKTASTVTHQNLFVGPYLSLSGDGSIYHPNLLRYYLNLEGSYGWNEDRVDSGTTTSRGEWEFLGRFSATITLLEAKPYHASVFVNYDHTYRDNDFFNRVEVASLRYGARAMWEFGTFTLNADYLHHHEVSSNPYWGPNQERLTQKSVSDDDSVTFGARQQRERGGTAFNYNLNHYNRTEGDALGKGTDHALSLSDSERWGPLEHNRFNASISYYRRDTTLELSDQVTAFATLNLEHNPNLNSVYDLNYDHFDTGSFRSDYYAGSASLNHQLYESLSSSISVRANDFETSDATSEGYTRRFGGGFSEVYQKHIAEDHRLRLKNALFVEHTEQQGVGSIKNERHSFKEANPEPNSFVLIQQNVRFGTILISDPNKVQVFVRGIDYDVIQFGNQTEIHRQTGSAIPDVVVVDYECDTTPPGSYENIAENAEIRLELWKNLLAFYGRANLSLNNAPASLRVQEVTDYLVGAETTWKAAHVGAEYELYDSTESHYRATRLFQAVSWQAGPASSLSLDATETWIDYLDTNRRQEDYRVVTRYHDQVTPHFSLGIDAGIAYRRGNGVDELLAAFRPSIKYVIGKTTIDAGYDFEYDLYVNAQQSQTHRFSLRCKRVF